MIRVLTDRADPPPIGVPSLRIVEQVPYALPVARGANAWKNRDMAADDPSTSIARLCPWKPGSPARYSLVTVSPNCDAVLFFNCRFTWSEA